MAFWANVLVHLSLTNQNYENCMSNNCIKRVKLHTNTILLEGKTRFSFVTDLSFLPYSPEGYLKHRKEGRFLSWHDHRRKALFWQIAAVRSLRIKIAGHLINTDTVDVVKFVMQIMILHWENSLYFFSCICLSTFLSFCSSDILMPSS